MKPEYSMDEPVLHVDYVCPKCLMTVRPPVKRDESVTWVDHRTRHYGHARCYGTTGEVEGVDNGGTMVAQQRPSKGH